jgi:2-amino-4-hydroxy-6-hydroxymethyldihydropteridine diphosphokinase
VESGARRYDFRVATQACIALGSNLGDRLGMIHAALDAIARLPGTVVVARSDVIETQPVGPVSQGPYLNAAAVVETALGARALLEGLLAIEASLGRRRADAPRWGPRTIDLDLVLFGEAIVAEEGLIVPHPRLHERRFVLGPLAQIAPEFVHPVLGRSVRELDRDLERAG